MKTYALDEKKIELLPVLNTEGIRIALDPREGLPILEEMKQTYLESHYTHRKE